MPTVTIKSLARELGLSIATVSKALNDSHEISRETKDRVLQMARHLNYAPNPYASSLRKRSSKTIAVVIPEVADSFFAQAINGIESVAMEKGYHVLIYLTHENFEREKSILRDIQSGRADGVLISVSCETPDPAHIEELSLPTILFDRVFESMPGMRIVTDDMESSRKATELLLENGCRRIAFLSISNELSITSKRIQGHRDALEKAGLGSGWLELLCQNETIVNHDPIKAFIREHRPDGIIASVEKLAAPVYTACRELNLVIPDQVKLLAFSNLQSASILNPSLTTIVQPAFEMGRLAASSLCNFLRKPTTKLKSETVVIPSQLIKRESTASKNLIEQGKVLAKTFK